MISTTLLKSNAVYIIETSSSGFKNTAVLIINLFYSNNKLDLNKRNQCKLIIFSFKLIYIFLIYDWDLKNLLWINF